MRLVLDTSVVAKWSLEEQDSAAARRVLYDIEAGVVEAHNSTLPSFEWLNALTKGLDRLDDVHHSLHLFDGLVARNALTQHPASSPALLHAATLASLDTRSQGQVSAYDAVFPALAPDSDATLITADAAHVHKTEGAFSAVVLLSEYAS
ncbi:MAG: PIN domain-containing protein [Gammaproteobacteria bacterium]|nr:PIN domain-containing protein [Gammaproteobacteria bacterium]